MNSRNHHMYSSVGQLINERFAGISVTHHSAGWNEVVMHVAPALGLSGATQTVRTQRGTFNLHWQRHGGTQCAKASENTTFSLDCGARGGAIQNIVFASWGTPTSHCGMMATYACHADRSADVVKALCMGKPSCSFRPTNDLFGGDPCGGTMKWLSVTAKCAGDSLVTAQVVVPTSAVATVRLPYYNTQGLTVREGSQTVLANGVYVPGVAGVTGATISHGVVSLALASGQFDVALSGSQGARICAKTAQGQVQTLTCTTPSHVITHVSFASYGRSFSECSGTLDTGNDCHMGSSLAVVEGLCIGKHTCDIRVSDAVFGDACMGLKHLISEAYCGTL